MTINLRGRGVADQVVEFVQLLQIIIIIIIIVIVIDDVVRVR